MSIITINTDNKQEIINLDIIEKRSYEQQVLIFEQVDKILIEVNQQKYRNSVEIIKYIKSIKIPLLINRYNITLLSLLLYFQKIFTTKPFYININNFNIKYINFEKINIRSKINNFPHLIGISGVRNELGIITSKEKPKKFIDGVIYQYILMESHDNYKIDFEKLEVFSWITQTLSNPTYILTKDAINTKNTKLSADFIFIRKVMHSDKYAFHVIGLKHENTNNFAFISQFAISKKRYYRINLMFDLKKAVYSFYNKDDT
mgnify:CR=1 FL=1